MLLNFFFSGRHDSSRFSSHTHTRTTAEKIISSNPGFVFTLGAVFLYSWVRLLSFVCKHLGSFFLCGTITFTRESLDNLVHTVKVI